MIWAWDPDRAARVVALIAVLGICAGALAQDGWPKPTAEAARLQQELRIDGRLEEPAWAAGQWYGDFTSGSTGAENAGAPKPAAVQTRFKVLYDDGAIYVGVECDEPTPEGMRVRATEHDGNVYTDDCVEVFFDPAGEGRYYHHFVINTQGAWYDDYSADYGLVHGKLWDCAIEAAACVDFGPISHRTRPSQGS